MPQPIIWINVYKTWAANNTIDCLSTLILIYIYLPSNLNYFLGFFLQHLAVIINIIFNLYMHYSIIQKYKVQEQYAKHNTLKNFNLI